MEENTDSKNVETKQHFMQSQFLIAMPNLSDPYFDHSVTLICQHTDEGSFGLTINRPIQLTVKELFSQLNIPIKDESIGEIKALSGGPVQPEQGFIIHDYQPSKVWENTIRINDNVFVTASQDILVDIANGEGPENFLLTLGCASWTAGQMEAEVLDNSWLNCDADNQIIFDTPYEKRWQNSVEKLGVDTTFMSNIAGHD